MTVGVLQPEHLDPEAWQDELESRFPGLKVESSTTSPPRGRIRSARLGSVSTFQIAGSPQVVRRPLTVAREVGGPLKVCLLVRGTAVLHQSGRELVVRPGQLALYDTAQPYTLRLEGRWECDVMTFPLEALGVPRRWVDEVMSHTHDATGGPGAVLRSFIEATLQDGPGGCGGGHGLRFAEAGLALVASALTPSAQVASMTGAAESARRMQVLDHVRRHLRDPSLTPASVAGAHGMSPRSLDRLFASETTTVASAIRAWRLEGARRDLADPRWARHTIGVVAARWCFPEPAHFSRAFKAQFGVTPSDFQRRATTALSA